MTDPTSGPTLTSLDHYIHGSHGYSDNVRTVARIARQELYAYGEASLAFCRADEDLTMTIILEDSTR